MIYYDGLVELFFGGGREKDNSKFGIFRIIKFSQN